MEECRIVIGSSGQIGSAIYKIFDGTFGADINHEIKVPSNLISAPKQFEDYKPDRTIMHICIPYTKDFIKIVVNYIVQHEPNLTIIHSTVPVGTTMKIYWKLPNSFEGYIVHCPINGRHPNIESDIKKYDMFVGGYIDDVNYACDYIERFGINTYPCDGSESTEFLKLASTEHWRRIIEFHAELRRLCEKSPDLNWDECIAFFENLLNNGAWRRFNRRSVELDSEISGKHCLKNNKKLWDEYAKS